jgi:hypothetical protein
MKMKLLPMIAVTALTMSAYLCSEPAQAQKAASSSLDQVYTIYSHYTLNDLLLYKMGMNMTLDMRNDQGTSMMPNGPVETTSSASVSMKTVSVTPDGSAVLEVKTSNMKVMTGGKEVVVPEPPAVKMNINKYGMAKMSGFENSSMPQMQMVMKMMNMQNMPTMAAILPHHPVKAGDEWVNEIPSPMMKGATLTVKSKLLGVEVINGVQTLKLSQTFSMPISMAMGADGSPAADPANAAIVLSGNMSADSIMNILENNARMIRQNTKISGEMHMKMQQANTANGAAPMNMNMKMNGDVLMSLVKAGKASSAPAK